MCGLIGQFLRYSGRALRGCDGGRVHSGCAFGGDAAADAPCGNVPSCLAVTAPGLGESTGDGGRDVMTVGGHWDCIINAVLGVATFPALLGADLMILMEDGFNVG